MSSKERDRFTVVLESLHSDIKIIAEGHIALNDKLDSFMLKHDKDMEETWHRIARSEKNHNDKISGLNNKIESVETSLNNKIESVETSLNEKIESVETSLNEKIGSAEKNLSGKIDSVEKNLRTDIACIQSDVAILKTDRRYVKSEITDIKHTLTTHDKLLR